jgi:hypothetical protein
MGELEERFTLRSPALLKELYELAERATKAENDRAAALDLKASYLLNAVGLTLTIAFTFGGEILIGRRAQLMQLGAWRWGFAISSGIVAVAAGLLSAGLALYALRVRGDHLAIDVHAALEPNLLRAADDASGEEAVATYHRTMAINSWLCAQRALGLQEERAGFIFASQCLFFLFLIATLVASVFVIESAI